MVPEALKRVCSIALLGEEREGEFTLWPALILRPGPIRCAADHYSWGVAVVWQLGSLQDPGSIEVAGKNEYEVGGLRSLRTNEVASKKGQSDMPAKSSSKPYSENGTDQQAPEPRMGERGPN